MDIFENLENLNVSEECFDDILEGIAAALSSRFAPEDKRLGARDSVGQKMERFSARHPKIFKVASKIDSAIGKVDNALRKKELKYKSANDALKTMKPAGSIYGKNMYSDGQVELAKQKAKEKVPTNKYLWQK